MGHGLQPDLTDKHDTMTRMMDIRFGRIMSWACGLARACGPMSSFLFFESTPLQNPHEPNAHARRMWNIEKLADEVGSWKRKRNSLGQL